MWWAPGKGRGLSYCVQLPSRALKGQRWVLPCLEWSYVGSQNWGTRHRSWEPRHMRRPEPPHQFGLWGEKEMPFFLAEDIAILRVISENCFIFLTGWFSWILSKSWFLLPGSVKQFLSEYVGRHSAKPTEIRERIDIMFSNYPRIELFARQSVDGWDCWGNEV